MLTPEEQIEQWAAGLLVDAGPQGHSIHGDCCPDFSCCEPEFIAPAAERAAYLAGDDAVREPMAITFYLRGSRGYNRNPQTVARRNLIKRIADNRLPQKERALRRQDRESSPCPICTGPTAINWELTTLRRRHSRIVLRNVRSEFSHPPGYPASHPHGVPPGQSPHGPGGPPFPGPGGGPPGGGPPPHAVGVPVEGMPNIDLPIGVPWTAALIRCRLCLHDPTNDFDGGPNEDNLEGY